MQHPDRKARRCQREGQRRLERHRREKKLTSFGTLAAALGKQSPRPERDNDSARRKDDK
jgi:hypothetical protein